MLCHVILYYIVLYYTLLYDDIFYVKCHRLSMVYIFLSQIISMSEVDSTFTNILKLS